MLAIGTGKSVGMRHQGKAITPACKQEKIASIWGLRLMIELTRAEQLKIVSDPFSPNTCPGVSTFSY